jgi:cell wall-associated NlpC family hydrolase
MLHGIIRVPITDMRAEPDSHSERRSQALFGTPVVIEEVQKTYSRIALTDNYTGWCRTQHIDHVAFALWEQYNATPKYKVKADTIVIKSSPTRTLYPFRLLFGTGLVISESAGKHYFELPRGSVRAPINLRQLAAPKHHESSGVTGRKIVALASRFLGVPYLWGGISPLGFDCSGLVQAAFGFYGIRLPRDSKDQRGEGFAVERDGLHPGDLLFFPGHVAISCGGREFVHATASRGMVAIDSFDPSLPNYREDLDHEFEFARRISL